MVLVPGWSSWWPVWLTTHRQSPSWKVGILAFGIPFVMLLLFLFAAIPVGICKAIIPDWLSDVSWGTYIGIVCGLSVACAVCVGAWMHRRSKAADRMQAAASATKAAGTIVQVSMRYRAFFGHAEHSPHHALDPVTYPYVPKVHIKRFLA